jgi:phosphohistidine phosphatase SixA
MFVLLRHAHALDKRSWTRPDAERPLSARGEAQALSLVDRLSAVPLGRIITSPTRRCRQTVDPLAGHLGIGVEENDVLGPDSDVHRLSRFLDDPACEDALLCTHGETLAALFAQWQSTERVRLPVPLQRRGKNATEKSGAWLVDERGGRLDVRYLSPPIPQPESVS